ncbi:hypothetical protein AAG906_038489 [Vitis piasezkii]
MKRARASEVYTLPRLDDLEAKGVQEVQIVNDGVTQACLICKFTEYGVQSCPTLPVQDMFTEQANALGTYKQYSSNSPYSNTYNPGWRNHPNLSWREQGFQPQGMPSRIFNKQHQTSSSNSSLEDMMRVYLKQDKRNEYQNRINAQTSQELVDIRTTLSQLAISLSQEKGKFPTQPRKIEMNCNVVITLRNEKEYEGPKLPVSEEDIPARDEPTVETNVRNEKASEKYEEVIVSKNKMSVSNHLPFPSAMQRHKVGDKTLEILEVLKQVKINIPLLDMIKQVPTYAKFLKDLCIVKRRIKLSKKAFLTEQVGAIIENKAMVKYKDPVILPCQPFLATTNALINCRNGLMQLSFGNMTVEMNVFNLCKQPMDHDDVENEEACLIEVLVQEHIEKLMEENIDEFSLQSLRKNVFKLLLNGKKNIRFNL